MHHIHKSMKTFLGPLHTQSYMIYKHCKENGIADVLVAVSYSCLERKAGTLGRLAYLKSDLANYWKDFVSILGIDSDDECSCHTYM